MQAPLEQRLLSRLCRTPRRKWQATKVPVALKHLEWNRVCLTTLRTLLIRVSLRRSSPVLILLQTEWPQVALESRKVPSTVLLTPQFRHRLPPLECPTTSAVTAGPLSGKGGDCLLVSSGKSSERLQVGVDCTRVPLEREGTLKIRVHAYFACGTGTW